MNRYFVDYKLHNKVNGGWAYKTEKSTDDYDEALKAFHNQCATYIGGDTFDHACITLVDAQGNVLKAEVWDMPFSPEPTPEITE